MTDAALADLIRWAEHDGFSPNAEAFRELLAYRRATRRLRKVWCQAALLSGGPLHESVLGVLNVEER